MDTNALSDCARLALLEMGLASRHFAVAATSRFSIRQRSTHYCVLITFERPHAPAFAVLRRVEDALQRQMQHLRQIAVVEVYVREQFPTQAAGNATPTEGHEAGADTIWADTMSAPL